MQRCFAGVGMVASLLAAVMAAESADSTTSAALRVVRFGYAFICGTVGLQLCWRFVQGSDS